MLLSMLEAISEMLKDTKETEVKCAKIMLDKVIVGMSNKSTEALLTPEPIKIKSPKPSDKIELIMSANNTIADIRGAKDDTIVELDGKQMPWKEAIDKSFSNGRIV